MNYLITFRTYGTWLHGDERGSVHKTRNRVGEERLEHRPHLENYERQQMRGSQVVFNAAQRDCIEAAICEVATHRGWEIHALAVQTNHVHVVVEADCAPEKAMNDFKGYATRRLRDRVLVAANSLLWTRHGSTRHLVSSTSLHAACRYVVESQTDLTDCP